MGSNLHLDWAEINGYEDKEFYGFRGDSDQGKKRPERIYRKKLQVMGSISRLLGEKPTNGKKRTQTWET